MLGAPSLRLIPSVAAGHLGGLKFLPMIQPIVVKFILCILCNTNRSAMPVHIYILSCSQSLANASQPFVSSSHASPVRVRDLVLPSLSRLYEGRSRWDVHTVVISVGDKSGPALSTLPTVTRALVEVRIYISVQFPSSLLIFAFFFSGHPG
jgi:hypothetical protein